MRLSGQTGLHLMNLLPLMSRTSGRAEIVVGLIDGPVDLNHPAFAGTAVRTVRAEQVPMCRDSSSGACSHGTAIAGILFAQRGVSAPGLCPNCTALIYPMFSEDSGGGTPSATPVELARAIRETVDAGARIINLSLGIVSADINGFPSLESAFDYAARRGVLLVTAAGNQGRMGFLPHVTHPWIIPVAACDEAGRVLPESNLSPSIGAKGLCAAGANVTTTAPGSHYAPVSGTSISAAHVTGGLALLWSEFPRAHASQIRRCALQAAEHTRRTVIPPLFNAERAREICRFASNHKESSMVNETQQEAAGPAAAGPPIPTAPGGPGPDPDGPRIAPLKPQTARPRTRVTAQSGGSCPTCAAASGGENGPPAYIYALGTIEVRFPSLGIEKEFKQSAARGDTASLTDRAVLHATLKENRHLANEVCWVFTVESVDTYLLVPRDKEMLEQFIEACKPGQRGLDVDVIIGTRGPMAPAEMCNGLQVPLVIVDQAYSFDRPSLLKAIKKPKDSKASEDTFRADNDELFNRIQQLADNVGASDEHRALNYLAVRSQDVYSRTVEMHARDFSLSGVSVIPSRLSVNRKLVDVIFTFTNRGTDVEEKYYVRVDVTEKYPFIDKKWAPYYDRQ
ncbi:MAG TPA: S8 family serine peptidase [Candidatus Solibacter sp.]|nr:S8 family serine peptidase [Candidatus Solibacter sp.]